MKFNSLILIVLLSFAVVGCEEAKSTMQMLDPKEKEAEKVSLVPKVEDVQLAQLVLKPKRKELDVSRDPFKPLFEQKQTVLLPEEVQDINEVKFIGVAKVDDKFLALMKTKTGKKVFRISDKIKDYTIEDINADRVILNNGVETITLKRGVVN